MTDLEIVALFWICTRADEGSLRICVIVSAMVRAKKWNFEHWPGITQHQSSFSCHGLTCRCSSTWFSSSCDECVRKSKRAMASSKKVTAMCSARSVDNCRSFWPTATVARRGSFSLRFQSKHTHESTRYAQRAVK